MPITQCIDTFRPKPASKESAQRRDAAGGLARDHRAMAEQVAEWCKRIGYRRSLKVLPDRMLASLGLTRAEAADEAAKPFWQP